MVHLPPCPFGHELGAGSCDGALGLSGHGHSDSTCLSHGAPDGKLKVE